jgi:hypothetical protein
MCIMILKNEAKIKEIGPTVPYHPVLPQPAASQMATGGLTGHRANLVFFSLWTPSGDPMKYGLTFQTVLSCEAWVLADGD